MSKGKTTQTSNQQMNGTTSLTGTATPTAPDWISTAVQNITGQIGQNAGADPHSFVAGANPLLTTAANSAGDLTTSPWNYDAAGDLTRGVANAKTPSIAANIGQFMDPYLTDVVNATSADLDHSDSLARAQDNLTMAGNGAFGGSGAALAMAITDDALSRARATSLGNLRSQGFGQALGGATSQAQLQQQQQAQRLAAANNLVGISSASSADQRANIAAQDAAAQPLQSIAQANASAPLSLTSWASSTLPNLLAQFFGRDTTGTQNTSQTSSGTGTTSQQAGAGQMIGGLAQLASLFI